MSSKESSEWELEPLGNHLQVLTDYTANGSFASLKENITYYNEPNYAVLVRTTDLKKAVFEPARFTDQLGYSFLKKSALFPGDIVIANVGSAGEAFRVPDFPMPMTLAPNMYLVRFKPSMEQDFAFQVLTSPTFKQRLLEQTGSTTLKAINKSNLRSIRVRVPPLSEQKKIAAILSSVDEAIQATQAVIEQTQRVKEGLLQDLLTRGIGKNGRPHTRFQQTEIGEIPEGWEVRELSEVARIIDCKHRTPKYSDHGFPVVRPGDVQEGPLSLDGCLLVEEHEFLDLIEKHKPAAGDIVYSRNQNYGTSAYVDSDADFAIGQDVCILQPENLRTRFLHFVLSSNIVWDQIRRLMAGSTFKRINLGDIRKLKIPLVPEAEQRELEQAISSTDLLLASLHTQVKAQTDVKSGLLRDLLTGKVRVSV